MAGTLVVNFGKLLERWTGHRIKAVLIGEYVVLLAGGRGDARVFGAAVTLGFLFLHGRGIRAGGDTRRGAVCARGGVPGSAPGRSRQLVAVP